MTLMANDLTEPARAAFAAAMDAFARDIEAERVVGAAVYLLAQGGVCARWFHGQADLESRLPADERAVVHWTSLTTAFTALAAMQLVERGLLDLAAPVVHFVPELMQAQSSHGAIALITVEHLLSHSSGLRAESWPWDSDAGEAARTEAPHEPKDWASIAAMMPYTSVAFPPGARFAYSSLGYVLIGRIIDIVMGEDVELYIDKNVLRPLSMFDTFFDISPYRLETRRARSYTNDGERFTAHDREFDTGVAVASGGLNGTCDDMAKFAAFLLQREQSPGPPLLQPATVRQMMSPRLEVSRDARRRLQIGLGFFLADETDAAGETRSFIAHSGFQLGHRSSLHLSADGGYGFFSWANTATRGGNPSAGRLCETLVDTVFPALVESR